MTNDTQYQCNRIAGAWHRRRHLIILYLATMFLATPAFAGTVTYQSQEPLREMVQEYLQQLLTNSANDAEITIGRLDSRLRLTACSERPAAFIPPGSRLSGRLTVGMQCNSPKPWTLYIPAEIRIFTHVVAAALPLSRGSVISKQDVISVRQEVSKLHKGYFTDPKQVIGKVLKQAINQGVAFSPRRMKAPLLVRQGEEVSIIASVGNLQVRSKGKALKNAAKGEKLSVRNIRSKRVIEAVAIRPGTVGINM